MAPKETLEKARWRMANELWENSGAPDCNTFEDLAEESLTTYASLAVETERERLRDQVSALTIDVAQFELSGHWVIHRLLSLLTPEGGQP